MKIWEQEVRSVIYLLIVIDREKKMKWKHTLLLCIMAFTASACNNPCQQICLDIRDFAKDCGEPFTDEDLSECIRNQGKKTSDEKKSCSQARPELEAEWECDNLEVFFD